MSFRRNILANYISQVYVTLIGIILVPLYIKYMGTEAYGLVGFFSMLQAWFNLLDLGLSPTINRQTAQFRGGAISSLEYRRLVRSLSMIFVSTSILGVTLLLSCSEIISNNWLKTENISKSEAVICIQIMAVTIGFRWIGGLYRGIINGSEKHVWLSFFSTLIATLRFVIVIPVMWIFGKSPTVFFSYQLIIAIIESIILHRKNLKLLPKVIDSKKIGWSLDPVKEHLRFALSIAGTSSLWVIVTQVDKLILSGTLSLKDYGYFTIATLIAGSLMILSGPVSNALIPRLTRLISEHDTSSAISTYRNSTRILIIPTGTLTLALAYFSKEIIFVWSGNEEIVKNSSLILTGYAIGNGLMIIASLPSFIQFAYGNLRIHIFGSIFYAALLLPSTTIASINYGGVGAAYSWLFVNAAYIIIFPSIIHNRIDKKLHKLWMINDVTIPLFLITVIFTLIASALDLFQPIEISKLFAVSKIFLTVSLSAVITYLFIKRKN